MKWWENPIVSLAWTILRVWLGVKWLEAGWYKVVDGFEVNGFLQGALAKATGEHPAVQSWYASFIENFAIPNAGIFNVLVPWGEVLVGIGLILGAATIPALLAGAFMNLNFLLAGTVSTNPILMTVAIILLFVGTGATYWGADRFLTPYFKKQIQKSRGLKTNY